MAYKYKKIGVFFMIQSYLIFVKARGLLLYQKPVATKVQYVTWLSRMWVVTCYCFRGFYDVNFIFLKTRGDYFIGNQWLHSHWNIKNTPTLWFFSPLLSFCCIFVYHSIFMLLFIMHSYNTQSFWWQHTIFFMTVLKIEYINFPL